MGESSEYAAYCLNSKNEKTTLSIGKSWNFSYYALCDKHDTSCGDVVQVWLLYKSRKRYLFYYNFLKMSKLLVQLLSNKHFATKVHCTTIHQQEILCTQFFSTFLKEQDGLRLHHLTINRPTAAPNSITSGVQCSLRSSKMAYLW